MGYILNIDDSENVALTNKLEKLHKSAMPVAVRGTLNDLAFEAKKKHLPRTFEKAFTVRKKGFVNSHSRVNKSPNTFKLSEMEAEMGIVQGKSDAGDELKKQEFGGQIKGRDYIPLPGPSGGKGKARTSGSYGKTVSKRYYLTRIEPEKHKPVFKQQGFIRAAFAAGVGEFLRFGEVLLEIKKLSKPSRDHVFIKAEPIYSYEQGRSITLDKRPFIQPAGVLAQKSTNKIFREQAKKRFEKYMKA